MGDSLGELIRGPWTATNSVCFSLQLTSQMSRSLPYTHLQVTAVTDATNTPLTGHNGSNSDAKSLVMVPVFSSALVARSAPARSMKVSSCGVARCGR